jgi:nicotinamide mononucleotide transporter
MGAVIGWVCIYGGEVISKECAMKDLLVTLITLIVFSGVFIILVLTLGGNIWWSWLASKRKVRNWPIGIIYIISELIIGSAVEILSKKSYANYGDIAQQLILLVTCIYGWRLWRQSVNADGTISDVRFSDKNTLIAWGVGSIIVAIVYGYMYSYLHQMFPAIVGESKGYVYLDSLSLVFLLVINLLIAQKKVEAFVYWIIGDFISIFQRILENDFGSYISLLFIIHSVVQIIIGFIGLREWRKAAQEYRAQEQTVGQ